MSLLGTLEETNPNYPLPEVTKGLDFEDLEKNEASYDDDDESVGNKSDQEVILDDAQLTFTSPIVYGFSLSDKCWRKHYYILMLSLILTFC